MLTHLHIQNYALIDALDIDLAAGFSVITGETGAGKSILLGALGLLLGQRADSKAIKPGAAKCCVEATFDINTLDLAGYFEENDLDYDPAACTVRREVLASGKSRSFVNDTPVNLQQLRALTSRLVDIHSQHKNLLINEEKFLLDLLDGAAANTTLLTRYAEAYHDFTRTKREISQLNLQLQQARDEQDYLSFQASQLDEANLTEGEQEELEAEQQILTHAEEIKNRLYQVVTLLQEGEVNALEALRASQQHLDALGNVFADAAPLADRLQSTCIEVSDICAEAERHAERVEFDPERLAYVTDRLNLIYTLEQKHRVDSVGELLRIGRELNERLQAIQTLGNTLSHTTTRNSNCIIHQERISSNFNHTVGHQKMISVLIIHPSQGIRQSAVGLKAQQIGLRGSQLIVQGVSNGTGRSGISSRGRGGLGSAFTASGQHADGQDAGQGQRNNLFEFHNEFFLLMVYKR